MSQASRTEYKKLSEELTALKKERNTYTKGMEVVSSKISKFHERIEKLNDSLWKISLRSPLIGQDLDKNDYWVFKEDLTKIYVKNPQNEWSIYDDEQAIN